MILKTEQSGQAEHVGSFYVRSDSSLKFHQLDKGKLLYKYVTAEGARRLLQTQSIRFTPIIEFNDPFELYTFPSPSFSSFDFGYALAHEILNVLQLKEEIDGKNVVADLVRALLKLNLNEAQATEFAMETGVSIASKGFVQVPSQIDRVIRRRLAKTFGAFCMTETYDNLLMWAHYADCHKGYVFGIDPNQGGDAFQALLAIKYQDLYPTKNDPAQAAAEFLGRKSAKYIDNPIDLVKDFVASKSSHWSHEKEWRALRKVRGNFDSELAESDIVSIEPHLIKALYCGVRANKDEATNLGNQLLSLNPQAMLMKAQLSTRAYGLDFSPINEPWPELYPNPSSVI